MTTKQPEKKLPRRQARRRNFTPLDFDGACAAHKMIDNCVKEYARHPRTDAPLREAWDALLGNDIEGVVADAIRWTVPVDMIPMLRWFDGVAAGFALCCIAAELATADVTDDLQVRDAVRRAWQKFEERRMEANKVEEGFGCDQSESWHTLRNIVHGVDQKAEERVMAIAELAGRMFRLMRQNMIPTRTDDPQEVKEATVGGDVERLLASEMALLSNPDTADATAIKILERRALQYRYQGESTRGRGPMVLAIDESGSMHDAQIGYRGRNTWAKGASCALTRIAWMENRAVRAVHFGTSTVVQELPQGDQDAMFELAHSFLSGGTSIESALLRAVDVVGDLEKEGFDGADIVLLSDGEDHNHAGHERVLDQMAALGIRLWTIGIGVDISPDDPIRKRAAKYIFCNDYEMRGRAAERLAQGLEQAAQQNAKHRVN